MPSISEDPSTELAPKQASLDQEPVSGSAAHTTSSLIEGKSTVKFLPFIVILIQVGLANACYIFTDSISFSSSFSFCSNARHARAQMASSRDSPK